MTDQRKPTEIKDEVLEHATGGASWPASFESTQKDDLVGKKIGDGAVTYFVPGKDDLLSYREEFGVEREVNPVLKSGNKLVSEEG